jgi:hypothetical protein
MLAGADGIRFQSPNFQVSFWKLSDYVLRNLLFFSEEIKKKRLEKMVLKGKSTLYMVTEIGIYVWVI